MYFCRIVIFSLLLCKSNILFAQQTIFQYDLDENKAWQAKAKLDFFDGKVLATLMYETGIDRFLLQNDSMLQHTSQQVISTKDSSRQQSAIANKDLDILQRTYMCGYLNRDTLVECYDTKSKKELYFTQTILSSAVTTTTDTLLIAKEENFLVAASMNNVLYVMYIVDKTDKLKIYVKRNGEKMQRFEKTIPFSNPAEKKSKKNKAFADYFSRKGKDVYFTVLNNASYLSNISAIKNKIYVLHDKIIFSLENSIYETFLVTITLSDFSHTIRRYPSLPGISAINEDPADFVNSYLKDSLLCKAGVFQDMFFLQVFNLVTNELIYNNFINANDKKEISESPFFKSAAFSKPENKSPEKFMKLLKNEYFYVLFDNADSNKCNISMQFYDKATFDNTFGIITLSLTANSELIQNSINYTTGELTGAGNNNKSLYRQMKDLKYFIEHNTVNAQEPDIHIINGSIYATCVDKEGKKLYVYKY